MVTPILKIDERPINKTEYMDYEVMKYIISQLIPTISQQGKIISYFVSVKRLLFPFAPVLYRTTFLLQSELRINELLRW